MKKESNPNSWFLGKHKYDLDKLYGPAQKIEWKDILISTRSVGQVLGICDLYNNSRPYSYSAKCVSGEGLLIQVGYWTYQNMVEEDAGSMEWLKSYDQ